MTELKLIRAAATTRHVAVSLDLGAGRLLFGCEAREVHPERSRFARCHLHV